MRYYFADSKLVDRGARLGNEKIELTNLLKAHALFALFKNKISTLT